MPPGNYSIKDISETLHTMGDHKRTLQTYHDDISMRTKTILTRFGGTSGILGFDEKSFSILYWVLPRFGIVNLPMQSKSIPLVYTMLRTNLKLSTKDKIHIKFDVTDGSVVKGVRQQKRE